MRLHALLASIVVVVGCAGGGKQAQAPAPAASDPIPKTAGPSCKAVVEHLATLADRDPTQPAKGDATLRARCESDAWNDDARNCFATGLTPGFGAAPATAHHATRTTRAHVANRMVYGDNT